MEPSSSESRATAAAAPELSEEPLRIHLEVFEGPMDLLLHLIRTQEIDVYDIPIAQVTDQYLRYLQWMTDLNINVAGEFLVMAATLILIKSRMLLPPDPNQSDGDEPSEDPRAQLVEQLLEYERFKTAAHLLYERETVELCVWPRGSDEFEDEEKEMVDVTVFELVQSFHRILERYKDQVVMDVRHESVTLEEKLEEVRRLLSVEREILFSIFLKAKCAKSHLVMLFFALLEMVRLEEVRLYQKGVFEDIRIVAC